MGRLIMVGTGSSGRRRDRLRPELRKAVERSWKRNEAAYRYLGRGTSVQDDLEKFLRAEIADREESIAELNHFIDALDITIGNALEAIGEFPPKPAGMPDRVDVICRLVVDYHAEIQRTRNERRLLRPRIPAGPSAGFAAAKSLEMSKAKRDAEAILYAKQREGTG